MTPDDADNYLQALNLAADLPVTLSWIEVIASADATTVVENGVEVPKVVVTLDLADAELLQKVVNWSVDLGTHRPRRCRAR